MDDTTTAGAPLTGPWPQQVTDRVVGWVRHAGPGPDGVDIAIVVICFAGFTVPVLAGAADGHAPAGVVAALGAGAALALLVRRRWPLSVLAGITAVEAVARLTGVLFTPFVSNAGPVFGIAVLTVADRYPRARSLLSTGVALVAVAVAGIIGHQLHPGQEQDTVQLVVAIPGWLIGDALRTRRAFRARVAADERRHAEDVERQVRVEERLRVSRDVHDVVSHALGMIAVRSGVARLLLDERPGEARSALDAIEHASRTALDELRGVLHHLRDDPPRVTGARRPYPPLVETTAYLVAQESLANVVRHAGPSHVVLEVRHETQTLVVEVVDDGPGLPGNGGAGLGLIGLRERVDLLGGEFSAGPRSQGGFAVMARFPIDAR